MYRRKLCNACLTFRFLSNSLANHLSNFQSLSVDKLNSHLMIFLNCLKELIPVYSRHSLYGLSQKKFLSGCTRRIDEIGGSHGRPRPKSEPR